MLEVMILISGVFLWHRLRENLYRRLFDPPWKITVCQRSCEEINSHFFTAPFYFAFIWFRVQGSGGGFAAFFRRWYSRIAAFPSRGRCPKGADRVTIAWKTAGIRFLGHSYESCKSPAADWTRKWDDRYFTSPFFCKNKRTDLWRDPFLWRSEGDSNSRTGITGLTI